MVAIFQLELAFNVILLIFSAYCFWYIGASVPTPDPGKMGAGVWPQLLLGALFFLIMNNIYNVIKKNKNNENNEDGNSKEKKDSSPIIITEILKHKFLWGSLILFTYTLILDYIGFVLSTVLFVFSYMSLLSEKRLWVKIIASLLITIVIYILFTKALQVPLPRGTSVFREFALWLENI